MYAHGNFINKKGDNIAVYILTHGDKSEELEIGAEGSGLYFSADTAVEITSNASDTFDVLLSHDATVNLLCDDFVNDFFCASPQDAVVNIYRNDVCVFAGFIKPQAYSQDYIGTADNLSLNCIDVIGALNYAKYHNIGSLGVSYASVKMDAAQRSFKDIMMDAFQVLTADLDILGGHSLQYLYDGSKAVDNAEANKYAIFSQLSINELLFLGDKEDAVWKNDDVVESILKYLNLHILQEGFSFYIFDWATAKSSEAITWQAINSDTTATMASNVMTFSAENAEGTETSISIGEVYNQIKLECKVESIDNVIESPLEKSSLTRPYSNKQKFMTEYISEGDGEKAIEGFYHIIRGEGSEYDEASTVDWYAQLQNSKSWKFPNNGDATEDLYSVYSNGKTNQQALLDQLGSQIGAAIVSIGKVENKSNGKDNSLTSKVDMSSNLVVSVNGNGKDDGSTTYPTADALKNASPVAVYNGGVTGGVFSPADDETTNYIVISGKIVLNPIMEMTDKHSKLLSLSLDKLKEDYGVHYVMGKKFDAKTVPSRNNKYGRFYTQQFWQAYTPASEPITDSSLGHLSLYTGTGPQQYEYNYPESGEYKDTISKVDVLACMLVIGDKVLVEKEKSKGQIDDFEWLPYKKREECASDDEYYAQSFNIGFDPKIHDKLIGTEFDVQNNISYTLGLDAEGMAIPIRQSDKLSGSVQFMILGPVYTIWTNVTRRHPTWFRHTKWTESEVPLLAHTSTIIVKDFEMKIYSDNGLVNNTSDKDLVYLSDTHEKFVNIKDGIEFKINSALTLDERKALGLTDSIKMSVPVNISTELGVVDVYDYNEQEQAKPERLYVNAYYNEYHTPHVTMEHLVQDTGDIQQFWHYIHPAMDKEFFAIGVSRNLSEGSARLTLKQLDA